MGIFSLKSLTTQLKFFFRFTISTNYEMKKIVFLVAVITALVCKAQQNEYSAFCATDELRHQLFSTRTDLQQGSINAQKRLQQFTQQYVAQHTGSSAGKRNALYIIPVVVHVIHNNGVENISDEQIYDAIAVANRNLRKQNADTTDIVPAFKAIAADCEIELRLATIDPNGNCTKGINRIVSPLTAIGDHQVKSLIHWDPSKYLNIYVCAEAAGLAGHALLPADADTVPEWDGIVIQHSYMGSIGTSTPFRSVVLTHELGHYFNLQHIWGGNNVPGFFYLPVGQPNNCNYDDDVSDTPNTIGWSNCNLNASSCGNVQDNVQNFMDYAYCARMLTEGQKLRMHACLNSPVANRNNLWQPANLVATGVSTIAELCAADFQADANSVCEGQTITFIDKSYHGVTGRTWSFSGGTPSSSTDSVVTVTYNSAGNYNVTLTATQGISSVSKTVENFVQVLPKGITQAPYYESFETYSSLQNSTWSVFNPNEDSTFRLVNNYAYNGNFSIMLNNFENPSTVSYDELISGTYNLNLPTTTSVEFKYAFAFKTAGNTADRLRVFISNDCGKTWTQRRSISGAQLSTAMATDAAFFPLTNNDWKIGTVPNINTTFLNDEFRIKFVFESAGGNNFFLEDINIGETIYTGTELLMQALNEAEIFPNPFQQTITFNFSELNNSKVNIKIYDLLGKEMLNTSTAESHYTIDASSFHQGIYIAYMEISGIGIFKKIIKQ